MMKNQKREKYETMPSTADHPYWYTILTALIFCTTTLP